MRKAGTGSLSILREALVGKHNSKTSTLHSLRLLKFQHIDLRSVHKYEIFCSSHLNYFVVVVKLSLCPDNKT